MATLFGSQNKSWQKEQDNFTFIDLFAGIGGFRIALENLGGKCVFSSEIDSECIKTYAVNFGEYPEGDIIKLDIKKIPKHEILCAGFPCQPFSISGHKKGFEDTRGTLFFNVLQVIKEKKPKVVFLENVKYLKYHDNKNTLKMILQNLEDIGYKAEWKILNAKDFGVAQNRERIIIIAHLKESFDFSKIEKQEPKKLREILDKTGPFEFLQKDRYTILPKTKWKKQTSGLIFCGYRNMPIRKNGVRPNTEHLSRVHKQPNRIYHIDGTHPTLPSQETSGRFWIYYNKKVRKLTINECFKLQGFPNDYEKISSVGACYNQIGNAVAVPMIEGVAKEIIKQLL
ncbi:MAG: DNA (cytosine-5-)-methyltransferase [Candidatus Spechtbacteria bacterium RIFCSPLOWO2_01_FULL_43_12]|uniref:Cytosine-specific methyltransferase n=1 Tax=Candidatus Spechtbacteria bacterium RIFCSPLOWO2_01_FULL_43_12 TaxID=1802162 RepID=A0A1G2HF40_9BACT|nr:MAG: DNA (cytosine-5-)-methyltransferase [Candidatus Spechtbacteria bacterium RIFCSPLOWO2_01_FULL_43_12]